MVSKNNLIRLYDKSISTSLLSEQLIEKVVGGKMSNKNKVLLLSALCVTAALAVTTISAIVFFTQTQVGKNLLSRIISLNGNGSKTTESELKISQNPSSIDGVR